MVFDHLYTVDNVVKRFMRSSKNLLLLHGDLVYGKCQIPEAMNATQLTLSYIYYESKY